MVVEGSEPIKYFWMYDGKWVEGGTESTLRLANLQARDFGAYNVLVRNQVGIEISKTAMLTVMSPPEITELTKSLTLTVGESVELTVTADGAFDSDAASWRSERGFPRSTDRADSRPYAEG